MDRERWERIQSVFHDLADRPESDRAALLKAACGGDEGLMADVGALLQEDARGASVLDHDVTTIAHQVLDAPLKSLPLEECGPYRIKGILGEGGMGVVYLAEREDLGSLGGDAARRVRALRSHCDGDLVRRGAADLDL